MEIRDKLLIESLNDIDITPTMEKMLERNTRLFLSI